MSPVKRASEPLILPPVGSVFLMPLADRRYGACRVIRHDEKSFGVPSAMVVTSRWDGVVARPFIEVCRRIFDETIDELMEFEGKPPKKRVMSALRECVTRPNRIDADHHFIATMEREDLCQEIHEIVFACGFPNDEGIADRWREW